MRGPLIRVLDAVTEHNRLTLLLVLVVSGVVAAGVPMLDTEAQAGPDADSFRHLDRVETAQYVEKTYGQAEAETAVTPVYVRDADGNVLSKASLLEELRYQRAMRERAAVRAALADDGFVGMATLVASRTADGSNPTIDEQIAALDAASPERVERLVAETLANDPRAARLLPAAHDPQTTTAHDRRLLVTFDAGAPAETRSDAAAALHEAALERSETGLFTLGEPAFRDFTAHLVGEMVELVVPVALLLILGVLAFAYRDPVDVVVGLTGVALSILWMFGIMGWLGVEAGTASIIPVVLITGLSVDFGFHVFNRYRAERGDERPGPPMRRAVRSVAVALLLVTITAAIGFLANVASPLAVLRSLGVSITLGVGAAFVLFTTAVPALKVSADAARERLGLGRTARPLGRGRFLEPILAGSVTLARRAAPVVVLVAVLGAAASGAAWPALDQEEFTGREGEVAEWKQDLPDPLGWEPHGYLERSEHVAATYQPVGAGDAPRSPLLVEGDVTRDDTLTDLRAGVTRIRAAGVVLESGRGPAVESPLTVIEQVAQRDAALAATVRAADTDGDGVPDSNLAAVYDALYAADEDAARRVIERRDGAYRSVLVTVTLDSADRSDRAAYAAALEAGARTASDGGERSVTVAGEFAVTQSILDTLQSSILRTTAFALAATILALAGAFRLRYGTASLGAVVAVPIVLVVGFVVGGMWLLGIPLNLLTALLMSLVVGVGIDYNIHVGDRFAAELHHGAGTDAALRAAVTGTGGALLGSTLTSVGAFSTLLLVPDPGLQTFGAIVVLALVTAFLVSVVVLPSALTLWSRAAAIPRGTPDRPAVAAQD